MGCGFFMLRINDEMKKELRAKANQNGFASLSKYIKRAAMFYNDDMIKEADKELIIKYANLER